MQLDSLKSKNQNFANLKIAFPDIPFFPGSTSDNALYTIYAENRGFHVSAFGITTGKHSDYHKITDDWEKINVLGLTKITDLIYKIVEKLALDN